jgi:hypothetical protein
MVGVDAVGFNGVNSGICKSIDSGGEGVLLLLLVVVLTAGRRHRLEAGKDSKCGVSVAYRNKMQISECVRLN